MKIEWCEYCGKIVENFYTKRKIPNFLESFDNLNVIKKNCQLSMNNNFQTNPLEIEKKEFNRFLQKVKTK